MIYLGIAGYTNYLSKILLLKEDTVIAVISYVCGYFALPHKKEKKSDY